MNLQSLQIYLSKQTQHHAALDIYRPLESDVAAVSVLFAIIAFCDLIKDKLQSKLPAHTVTHTMLSLAASTWKHWLMQSRKKARIEPLHGRAAKLWKMRCVRSSVPKCCEYTCNQESVIWSSAGRYREVTLLFIWLPLSLIGNQRTEIQHFLNLNFNVLRSSQISEVD